MKKRNQGIWKLMKLAFGVFILSLLTVSYFEKNPLVTICGVFAMIASASFGLFCWGTLPFYLERLERRRKQIVHIGSLGVFLAFAQFPMWVVLTGSFPPKDFSFYGAYAATIMVCMSFLLPMFPRVFFFVKLKPKD